MIHQIRGIVEAKGKNFVVIDAGGVGYKVFTPLPVLASLPAPGTEAKLFTHYQLREDGASLYGFPDEKDLRTFELLVSVSGIGPKSALGLLNITTTENLLAAIQEGKAELLTRVSGVGKKTAERIIVELKEKIKEVDSAGLVAKMESDADVVGALASLGYRPQDAKDALRRISPAAEGVEARLKEALKLLKK